MNAAQREIQALAEGMRLAETERDLAREELAAIRDKALNAASMASKPRVDHPDHYSGKVECIVAIEAATESLQGLEAFCTGNAIKYLWRWKRKNGVEDLEKARWYLDRLISSVKG